MPEGLLDQFLGTRFAIEHIRVQFADDLRPILTLQPSQFQSANQNSVPLPTGLGFYESIVDGHSIFPVGNSNYASLNDPRVNRILNRAGRGLVRRPGWVRLDHHVMQDAVYLPYVFGRTLYYRNPRMTNVTSDNALAFGIYDFVNAGVGG